MREKKNKKKNNNKKKKNERAKVGQLAACGSNRIANREALVGAREKSTRFTRSITRRHSERTSET